jgi:diguanylate cyclase
MTTQGDDHERTMAFAEIALGQIKALRQPATPRNYEVWYHYATGYNPSLNEMINEMLARSGALSDADIEEVYSTYLSPTRLTERLDKVSARVMNELDQVMSVVDKAAGSATSYSANLAGVSKRIGSADREGLRAIVESLVQTTKEMEAANSHLEARLNASKQEINQLQENLEVARTESLTDPLTSLANRKFFDQALAKAIAEAAADNRTLSLMMTDIDHFKTFNDTFGHLTGDQVLK